MKYLIPLILLAIGLSSCLSEFRPEVIDPRLPDYSEEGLNTAGAYVDGFPWMSRRHFSYFFVFPSGVSGEGDIYIYGSDSTSGNLLAFEFGELLVDDLEKPVSIGFYLADAHIGSPNDLLALKGKTVTLDGETNYGQLFLEPTQRTAQSGPDTIHRGVGQLHIRNVVQHVPTDSITLSGTFGFDIQIDSKLHTVHSGRFDYTVSTSEFHPFLR